MKPALICFAFILLVGLIGCSREHDKIVNAPPTESASSVAGWTDVSTSGIALRFPDDWKLIDLTREGFEQGRRQGIWQRSQTCSVTQPG